MKKEVLEELISEGLTLREIGERTGKHLTTVGYWMKRYGLRTVRSQHYAPKRSPITRQQLEELIADGASLSDLAETLGLSVSSVRYWLSKYGLKSSGADRRRRRSQEALHKRLRVIIRECKHHGVTEFVLEGRGYYRCRACRKEAVSRWRRRVKLRLIAEAGGCCAICGYDRHPGALHFHHLDPTQKRYVISRHGHTRSLAEARVEAKKCVLLCANCHAEVEANVATVPAPLNPDAKVPEDVPG